MFLRLHTIRGQGGKSYTYLEIALGPRRDGQVGQERVCSLGRVEELRESGAVDRMIAKLAQVARQQWVRGDALEVGARWSKDYGTVLLMRGLWQALGLGRIIGELCQRYPVEAPVEEALLALVVNRLGPSPGQRDVLAWLKNRVYAPQWETLGLHHLYQGLDFLGAHLRTVEEGLFSQAQEQPPSDMRLVLFDIPYGYPGGQALSGPEAPPYRGDERPEPRQAVMGVLATEEGLPVAHQVLPASRVESRPFWQMWGDLKERFPVGRVVVIAERGVAEASLLGEMEQEGLGYIEGVPSPEAGLEGKRYGQWPCPERASYRSAGVDLLRTATALPWEEVARAGRELGRLKAAFQGSGSGLEGQPSYPWTPARGRGYLGICFLALVVESALQRMLRNHGGLESSRAVWDAVQEVKAVQVEVAGQVFVARTELPSLATRAFAAVGINPPPHVHALPEESGSAMALPKECHG